MAKKTNLIFSRKFEGEFLDDIYEIDGKDYYLRIIKNKQFDDVCYEIGNMRAHEKLILHAKVKHGKDTIHDCAPNLNEADKYEYCLVVDGGEGVHVSEAIKNEETRRSALLCLLNRMYYDVYPFEKTSQNEIKLYWKINDIENEEKLGEENYRYFKQDEIAPLGEKIKFMHVNQPHYDYVLLDKKTVRNEFRKIFESDAPERQ